jgi:hypothetical protein
MNQKIGRIRDRSSEWSGICKKFIFMSRLRLSTTGLSHVTARADLDDFNFVVGGDHYHCRSSIAEFLSPKVARFREVDCTTSEFSIETPDPGGQFGCFLSLGSGSELLVPDTHLPFFMAVSSELENNELQSILLREFNEELTVSSVVDRLNLLIEARLNCSKELNFLATHFCELDAYCIENIHREVISMILASDRLQLKSEDWLYAFITRISHQDEANLSLLAFVRFDLLSDQSMQHFISVSSQSPGFLNIHLWSSLCARLRLPTQTQGSVREFKPDSPLSGIISFLTKRHGGNVHDLNIVKITASTAVVWHDADRGPAKYAAELGRCHSFFQSVDRPDQWLCYDFGAARVRLSGYSLMSYSWGDSHPKSWSVEVSRDGQSWVVVDQQINDDSLNGKNRVATWRVDNADWCKCIRVRQMGPNHKGNNYLSVGGFEVFGEFAQGLQLDQDSQMCGHSLFTTWQPELS